MTLMDLIPWNVGFLAFHKVTALDLAGPFEVLSRAFEHCFVIAEEDRFIQTSSPLKLVPDYSLYNCPPLHMLVVPGGPGQTPQMDNKSLLGFIRRKSAEAHYTAGVCTGTLLLAGAGILTGRAATTHWLAKQELEQFGCRYEPRRVVWDGNIVTGAGVSSGIDLALELVDRIIGPDKAKKIQLAIEYDPQPPYDCGSPEKAPAFLIEDLKSTSRFHRH